MFELWCCGALVMATFCLVEMAVTGPVFGWGHDLGWAALLTLFWLPWLVLCCWVEFAEWRERRCQRGELLR